MQAIPHCEIEFPQHGLVRFEGGNSNGKSVLVKTLNAVTSCNLHQYEDRLALINYSADHAEFQMEKYDGDILNVNIARESSETYYELIPADGTAPIRRYLADKNVSELVTKFGLHYNKNREISLNIYNTYDPLLFVTTSGVTNLELLDSIVNDPAVSAALDNIDSTLKDLDIYMKSADAGILQTQHIMSSFQRYNLEEETAKKERYHNWFINISKMGAPLVPEVQPVMNIENIEKIDAGNALPIFSDHQMKALYYIDAAVAFCSFPETETLDVDAGAYDEIVTAIKDSVCPLCKRKFDEE